MGRWDNDRNVCGRGGAAVRRRPLGARPRHPERGHRRQRPIRVRARTASSSTPRRSSTTTTATPSPPPATSQLNYQGRTLQADRVTYDRNTGRVFAEGNARLTEANGAVITGDRFELTDDFKSGFIDSCGSCRPRWTGPSRRPASRRRGPSGPRARPRLRARHLHGLRALQGQPGAPAALAGEGRPDHPQQQRADDLLRERHPRARRRAGRLPALFLDAGSDREAQDRLPGAALRLSRTRSATALAAVLLGARARTTISRSRRPS